MKNKHVKQICYVCSSYQVKEEQPYCKHFFIYMVNQSPNRFCKAFAKKNKVQERAENKRLVKFIKKFQNIRKEVTL